MSESEERDVETGIYVRIKRDDGRFAAVDICEMTRTELAEFVEKMDAAEAQKWVRGLVGWIRSHVRYEPSAANTPENKS